MSPTYPITRYLKERHDLNWSKIEDPSKQFCEEFLRRLPVNQNMTEGLRYARALFFVDEEADRATSFVEDHKIWRWITRYGIKPKEVPHG